MRVLIAEDERITRSKLRRQLEQMGHEVVDAGDGEEAWELFQAQSFSVVVSDWEMPKMNGLELVRRIRATETENYVYTLMLTGKSDKKDVVEAIEMGADDFVSKPFDRDELRARVNAGQRIVELEHHLAAANGRLRHELAVARELSDVEHRKHEESLLGDSIAVRILREGIQQHAAGDQPLTLTGPSGAGQEAVARAIHRDSVRRSRAFIFVDCAHIAVANESLFGLDGGGSRRSGKAALADGGTLYLEGVETLGKKTQAQLARFLEQSAADREQGQSPSPDVRLIASVSSPQQPRDAAYDMDDRLVALLDQNCLAVPSLAERIEDVTTIAERILERRARSVGKTLNGLSNDAIDRLRQYSWPGNLRELHSVLERSIMLAGGTLLEIPEELVREGRRVGGYTLKRRLGQGGMGEVWLAQHSLLARPSAVKLIRQSTLNRDAGTRVMLEERFEREARSTAQLRSPHTVELYDFGVTDDGDFYYVMEFLNGIDLHSLVARHGAIPPARAICFLQQACVSLHEAFEAQLVHRDIKPANLFACRLGSQYDFLKLLDFGIVKSSAASENKALSAGSIKGSPTSMSPEVVKGEEATHASDLYGLGCVGYWLLTGRHVFEASSVTSMLLMHGSEQPKPPSEWVPDLPPELDQLILRCLEKDPAQRPRDAEELGELLAAIPVAPAWDNKQAKDWWETTIPVDDQTVNLGDTSIDIRRDTKVAELVNRIQEEDGQLTSATNDDSDLGASPLQMSFADGTLGGGGEDWLGRRLGEFEVTRMLGLGEAGLVLKARDKRIERDVAIKVLSDEFAKDPKTLERFLSEAKVAGQLDHVNIVTIHEVVQEDRLAYLVMEWVAGGSAKEHLKRSGAFSPFEATSVLIDACKGLAAAHQAGLVHRDVKPASLLLTDKGAAKVCDFGLAKRADNIARQYTLSGQMIGSPHYMSPEQCESLAVDARSDVYSLGATYYSLLTAAKPYPGDDPMRVMLDHRQADPPDPCAIDPSIPEVCAQIIEQAMAKSPDQRYQSMEELLADLEAVMATVSAFRA